MRTVSPSVALAAVTTMAGLSAAATPSCVDGLHMIVARGSLEPPTIGTSANITDQVQAAIPHSDTFGITYPATLDNYTSSESVGVDAMHAAVEGYAKACPGSPMALLGYSQGAQIVMDTVCGGTGGLFTAKAAVASDILDSIVAMVVFGDPSHVLNLTYDRGTSQNPGLFQRNNTAPCLALASKLVSYCDANDVYCDGGEDPDVHHEYIDKYGKEMVSFIVDHFNNATVTGNDTKASASDGSSTSSNSSKPTPTSDESAAGSLAVPFQSLLVSAAALVAFTAALL